MVKTITEKVTKTVEEEKIVYVTQDGTRFNTEEQAREYDNSARTVIRAKFAQMEKRIGEMSNCLCSNDDTLIFIKMKDSYKDDLLQFVTFEEGRTPSEQTVKKIMDCKEGDELLLTCSVSSANGKLYFDFIYVVGTVADILKEIEDSMKSTEHEDRIREYAERENREGGFWYRNFMTLFGMKKQETQEK